MAIGEVSREVVLATNLIAQKSQKSVNPWAIFFIRIWRILSGMTTRGALELEAPVLGIAGCFAPLERHEIEILAGK